MCYRRLMPSVFQSMRVSLLLLFAMIVSACGSSSGSNSDEGGGELSNTVSGIVTDPAIQGAAVRLVDERGDALTRIQITDQKGRFSFELPVTVDLVGARAVAVGGQDVKTGQNLKGITLEARWASGAEMVVTPLTTLALSYEREGGTTAGLASLLGLEEAELTSDPANSPAAQRASILVTELMVAMSGAEDGISSLLDKLQMAGGDLGSTAQLLVADTLLPSEVIARLQSVQDRIEAFDSLAEVPTDAAGMVRELNRINIRDGVAGYLKNKLSFEPASEDEQANVNALADAIFNALNQQGLPAESSALLNIIRYVVVINALSADVIAAADFEVPQPIDPENILTLLADTDAVDSTLPLAVGEELGTDNAARVDYFFRSDLSPYYRAAKLFDGVIDDQIMDPLYADIAVGQAAAGLTEQAKLTAQSSIFQRVEKFDAYRRVGEQLLARNDVEGAVTLWQKALVDFQLYIDAKGLSNLSAEDGTFLSSLSGNFRDIGRMDLANEAFATMQAFLDAEADPKGELTTAYRVLMGEIESKAGELVDSVRFGGGSESEALSAVQLLEKVVFGAGQFYSRGTPLAGYCYNFRTLNLESAASYYEQLGRTGDASRMLDEYERLLQVECNWKWARNMVDDFAPIYGRLQLLDRLERVLVDIVEPMDGGVSAANKARSEAALYVARDLAIDGDIDGAIEAITESQESLMKQVSSLSFIGTGEGLNESKIGLSVLLAESGFADRAKLISDHVMEIVLSDEYLAEADASLSNLNDNATRPNQFLGQGCRKIAALYNWLGYPENADDAMAKCETRALGLFAGSHATTAEKAESFKMLAAGYQWLGNNERSRELLQTAATLVDIYSDPSKRAYEKQEIALLYAGNGDLSEALTTMGSAQEDLVSIGTLNSAQASLLAAVERAQTLGMAYVQIADMVRGRIAQEGIAAASQPVDAERARQALRKLWLESDSASGWPGTMAAIEQLNDPEERQSQRDSGIYQLSLGHHFNDAETLARSYELAADRNKALSLVARILTGYDDYPGSYVVRFDFDNDGLPDFFNPVSSQHDRNLLAVALDDDIDGDGLLASEDPTPYCATCEI